MIPTYKSYSGGLISKDEGEKNQWLKNVLLIDWLIVSWIPSENWHMVKVSVLVGHMVGFIHICHYPVLHEGHAMTSNLLVVWMFYCLCACVWCVCLFPCVCCCHRYTKGCVKLIAWPRGCCVWWDFFKASDSDVVVICRTHHFPPLISYHKQQLWGELSASPEHLVFLFALPPGQPQRPQLPFTVKSEDIRWSDAFFFCLSLWNQLRQNISTYMVLVNVIYQKNM